MKLNTSNEQKINNEIESNILHKKGDKLICTSVSNSNYDSNKNQTKKMNKIDPNFPELNEN